MANELDETNAPTNPTGREIDVINKQLPVKIGPMSVVFEIAIWLVVLVPAVLFVTLTEYTLKPINLAVIALAVPLPGVIYLIAKINAKNFLQRLQQDIQAKASTIDNFLEQRVIILRNVVPLLEKAIELDKDVMKSVAALRSGVTSDANRNTVSAQVNSAFHSLIPRVEAYPELKAHTAIANAMAQNSYLQKEITAARELYNDTIRLWNHAIFEWPVKQIVAARAKYTTRIPFTASEEIKDEARATFF